VFSCSPVIEICDRQLKIQVHRVHLYNSEVHTVVVKFTPPSSSLLRCLQLLSIWCALAAGHNAGNADSFSAMICLIYAQLVYSYYAGVATMSTICF
jgi:hypothetical protein